MASSAEVEGAAVVDSSVRAPLDSEKWYSLDSAEEEFFTTQTGIQDPDQLKKHIIAVQADAYEVYPYPCIYRLAFTGLKIARLPAYGQLLKIGKERKGALFLDVGCCVGNDVRKAIVDGFPMNQALASDLQPEFWQIGHKLFKSTPNTFPVPFIPGDVFDPAFLAPAEIPATAPTEPLPPLSILTSLTPLIGRLSAIHASAFFHLFGERQQLELANRLAALLSPEPGSFILGEHAGRPEKGLRTEAVHLNFRGTRMFCHCPESWKEMWETEVFGGKGNVKVEAALREVKRDDLIADAVEGTKFYLMAWSVTRL
ncbi:hypothetical protein PHLCEN_2v1015 [Hermanssonia centrifuga]|uniref:Methyltransferase ausD n=1 Tax=Hermanssonia centrifuga TaxID=98765 RepID=A0A2R6S4F1_9APHY|nr:hypothetical protein PHLCEN_2v1015 [Hermanssonia centrifuga]